MYNHTKVTHFKVKGSSPPHECYCIHSVVNVAVQFTLQLSVVQEKLLEQIHFHLTGNDDLDSCAAPYCISHQCFALNILERVS